MHVCVCGRGVGTHEYCALSKRKNVSKGENVSKRENVSKGESVNKRGECEQKGEYYFSECLYVCMHVQVYRYG